MGSSNSIQQQQDNNYNSSNYDENGSGQPTKAEKKEAARLAKQREKENRERGKGNKKGKNADKGDDVHGFPTPTLLADAQRRYRETRRRGGGGGDVDREGMPVRCPPHSAKAEVFNPTQFKSIDRHAQQAPLELAERGYEELAAYLTKPTTNDVGKVRAFYVWIASQRLQPVLDRVGNSMPATDKPLFLVVLTLVKQWGNGYSELFQNLCKAASIPCRVVKGRVKGSGYRLGEKTRGTNDYCMVYVDGAWRFVDQHWGSQFVMGGVDSDEWEQAAQDDNKDDSKDNGAGQDNKKPAWDYICDDFYFLTDPEALVYTHLAVDPADQLLARPITEEEYWQMAYLKDAFFELEMTTVSHPKCLVETDDGIVVFEFGLSPNRYCTFSHALFKSANDPSLNLVNGASLDQYVLMETVSPNILRISIHFPRIGRYKFNLYGRDLNSKIGFTAVCEYAITVNKPDFNSEPFPDNTRTEWGPGAEVAKLGVDPQQYNGGTIYATDGRAEVHWNVAGQPQIMFQNRLKNPADDKEDLNPCIRYFRTENDASFHMKLPRKGQYVLHLYAKDKNQEKKFRNVCNYLVISDVGCFDAAPFPPCNNKFNQTGDLTNNDGNVQLTPVSHRDAVIDPYDKGEIAIKMASNSTDSKLRVQMHRYYEKEPGGGCTEEDCSLHALVHQENQNVNISAQFPQVGYYKINVLSGDEPVYEYIVNAQEPNIQATPFPEQTNGWNAQHELLEPRSGLLETNRKVHVKVHVPGARSVKAVGQNTSTDLVCAHNGTDIWEGDVMTEQEQGTLSIVADKDEEQDNPLLVYKVLDSADAAEVKRQQLAAQREREMHLRDLEQQKILQANEAKKNEKASQDRARKAQDDFRANESKYRKEEAQFQKREEEEEEKDAAGEDQNEEEEEKMTNLQDQQVDLMQMIQTRQTQPAPVVRARVKPREEKINYPVTGRSDGGNPQYQDYLNEEDSFQHKPSYKVDGNDGWKKYHPHLSQKMALEKLRESIRNRDVTMLRHSIADCQDYGMESNKEVKNASNIVTIFDARRKLDAAYENRDHAALQAQIEYIKNSGLAKQMPNELREASYRLETLERANHLHDGIMDMDKRTMSEVRRYQNPPPMMHKVMQGSFLLLGEDEDSTENWKDCQRLLNPQGANGLNKKIMDFRASNVNPEIVARSKDILGSVDIAKVRGVCPAAGTFYVWAMGVIEECEVTGNYNADDVEPANVGRQKELLGRMSQPDVTRAYNKSQMTPRGSGGRQPHGKVPWDAGTGRIPGDATYRAGDASYR